MRKIAISIFLTIILTSLFVTSTVSATGSLAFDWQKTWDFRTSSYAVDNWTIGTMRNADNSVSCASVNGSYVPGEGFRMVKNDAVIDWNDPRTLVYMKVILSRNGFVNSNSSGPWFFTNTPLRAYTNYFISTSNTPVTDLTWWADLGETGYPSIEGIGLFSCAVSNWTTFHYLQIRGLGTCPFPSGCDDLSNYTKPLSDSDEQSISTNSNNSLSTLAFSNSNFAYVHAPTNGYIAAIRPVMLEDCESDLGNSFYGIYGPVDSDDHYYCHFEKPDLSIRAFQDIDTGSPNAYLVTVQGTDHRFNYYLDSVVHTLSVGDAINDSCVLGYVAKLRDEFSSLSTDEGLVAIAVYGGSSQIGSLTLFDSEPTGDNFCADASTPYNDDLCINVDMYLEDNSLWYRDGTVGFLPYGGALLDSNSKIEQTLNLDSESNPTLTVGLRTDSTVLTQGTALGPVALRIGDVSEKIMLYSSTGNKTISLVTTDPNPDKGGFFTASIHNTSTYTITIEFVCVTHGDSGNDNSPVYCYFPNYTFDNKDEDWTIDALGFHFWDDGEVRLDGEISQALSLLEGDYTITAEVGLYRTSSYVAGTSGTISLEMDFDSTTYNLTTANYGDLEYSNGAIITEDFSIVGSASGTATISTDYTSATGVIGVVIRSVCIKEQSEEIFTSDCGTIANPVDDTTGAWIEWQWHQQNKFFRCELILTLNQMYELGLRQYNLFGWSIRWNMATIDYALFWFDKQFVGYLNGHFANITASGATGGSYSCSDFWCFLTEIFSSAIDNILSPLVDSMIYLTELVVTTMLSWIDLILSWLLGLLTILIGLMLSMLALIITTGFFALEILSAIINSYFNATPQPIPGLPSCATLDPDEHFWCAGLWVVENTVYAETNHVFTAISPGELLNELLIGLGTIHMGIWLYRSLKKLVLETGKSL
jgi:hypothetical protein